MGERKKSSTFCQKQNPIVLIGCGKKKKQRKTKAEWLYQGHYYYLCLSLARLLTKHENIFILSAKYGLISLDKMIEPYNLKITSFSKQEKENWIIKVKQTLKEIKGKKNVIFICGSNYHLESEGRRLLPNVGIGKQMQWMKNKIKELNNVQNNKED
jgi:hypothetical protein